MKGSLIGIVAVVIFVVTASGNSSRSTNGNKVSVSCMKKNLTNDSSVTGLIESKNRLDFSYEGFTSEVIYNQKGEWTEDVTVNSTGRMYQMISLIDVSQNLYDKALSNCAN